MSNPLQPMDCSPPGSSVHENSPSKNTGMGCHALLQRIFPTQGLNPGLPCCRRILYQPSYQGLKITNSHPFLIVSAWEQPTRDGSLKDCVDIKMMLWGIESWLCGHQFSSVAQSCPTLCDPINRSMPGLPVHHQLPEFTQTHIHRVSDAIQPSHPLSSHSPPTPNPSQHQSLFQWVNSLHEVAKVLVSALASFLPKNTQGWCPSEWTGWISLQSKGLKSLLQHHSSKASILRHSAFLTVQLSHPYMTTGKTIALTRQTFVGKVMSLLFNMLFRLS